MLLINTRFRRLNRIVELVLNCNELFLFLISHFYLALSSLFFLPLFVSFLPNLYGHCFLVCSLECSIVNHVFVGLMSSFFSGLPSLT